MEQLQTVVRHALCLLTRMSKHSPWKQQGRELSLITPAILSHAIPISKPEPIMLAVGKQHLFTEM